MPYTRDQVVAAFKRRFNQCDDATAQDLLYRIHDIVCTEIPVATSIARVQLTDAVAQYRVQASNFVDYANTASSGDITKCARVLQVYTEGYTTESQIQITSLDQLDNESWQHRVLDETDGLSTAADVAPTKCYVDYPWRASVSSESPFVFSLTLVPIPQITGTKYFKALCQVVSDLSGASDYIPGGLTGPDVYLDGMCYLYSKEADRTNTNYWFGVWQNTLKQEKWMWANRTRYQSNVYPAGFNLRDKVV